VLSQVVESIDDDSVALTFESDLIRLWDRTVYPDPAHAWNAQVVDYDVRTGAAETIALAYIDANAGPGALTAREVTGLVVPSSVGRGTSRTITARFDNLGRLVADLMISAGLRVRVLQDGTNLLVTVDTSPDLTATARYGTSTSGGPGLLGPGAQITLNKPDLTRALAAGEGNLAARVQRERADAAAEAAWGRRSEQVVEQSNTAVTAELDKAGDDALASGAQPVSITAPILDADEPLRLGVDVPPGALVALDLRRRFVQERLQQVTTTISSRSGSPTVEVAGLVGSTDVGLTRTQKEFLDMKKTLRKVAAR
jgi:hypothetical protein